MGVWNTAMIAELIVLKFGVSYNPRYLSSLLKKLGLTYQKACFISDRLDEEAYQKKRKEWVEKTWPGILRTAKATHAVIVFGDEISFRMWGRWCAPGATRQAACGEDQRHPRGCEHAKSSFECDSLFILNAHTDISSPSHPSRRHRGTEILCTRRCLRVSVREPEA
ncbi:MAG: winged helix-turn-helix domain-containing protein [bacterium]|nr:winged helix-turn-helix domain-containing protein [bacterium]